MKLIPLTGKHGHGKFVMVDDEDYPTLSLYDWTLNNGYPARGFSETGKAADYRTMLMHRVLAQTPDGYHTDHINGNKLDNQKANLRVCTAAGNMANMTTMRANNTSGYKGVTLARRASTNRWGAAIKNKGEVVWLGTYDTAVEAARAYNKAATRYFGEFARLNEVPVRVGIYCRISLDVAGESLGVARQEEECRRIAVTRGLEVTQVYIDNSLSAYKRKVVRPEFERLLVDLTNGTLDGFMVHDLDRLARQPKDLERVIDIYEAHPGLTFATVQKDVELDTADGRFFARLMTNFANKSSADTSRRVAAKHRELAQKGEQAGGNRAFGWKKDKITLEPVEAELIREATKSLLAGASLHSICRAWNETGVATPLGNPWLKQVMKNMLLNPRIAGWRSYHGQKALNPAGEPVRGTQEPILDDETWQGLVAVLTDPSRSGPHVHSGGRKYLLSGIVRCGGCSGLLRGNADNRLGRHFYSCGTPTSGGCGKVGVSGVPLDALITELVLRYLSEREVQRSSEPWSGESELAEVTGRIQELMSAFSSGALSAGVVFPTVTKLEAQVTALKDQKSAWLREQVRINATPTNVVEAWPTMDTETRRAVIESVLVAVAVKAVGRRHGNKFQPERITPVWR